MINEKQRRARAQRAIETYIANCGCRNHEDVKTAAYTMLEMANDCVSSFDEGRAIMIGVPGLPPSSH